MTHTTSKSNISVCIPVGPFESNKRWLREALDSIAAQTLQPTDVVLIDDGAQLDNLAWLHIMDDVGPLILRPCVMPWHTGVSHGFNYGVMLAQSECVFMLGSDDTLQPTCLEDCMKAYNLNNQRDAYYSVPIEYMDTKAIQITPCNAAMVTKGLWKVCGGFPVETAIGAGDAALLSILMVRDQQYPSQQDRYIQHVGHLIGKPTTPLYNYRRHPDIHTYKMGSYWTLINEMRDILTNTWDPAKIAEWSDKY